MRTSPVGRALIEKFEGCVLHTYYDVVGVPTIGYGCTGPEAWPGRTITKAQADEMLADRLAREFEPGVMAAIGAAPTTQAQFDAMVSLAFNIGVGGFKGSTVARMHKAGNHQAAADAFAMWNKAGGRVLAPLTRRRREEAALYLSTPPSEDRLQARQKLEDAVRSFQKAYGLEADGVIGPNTLRMLNAR